ncbi:unnamed protein product [Somion occarium]
MSVDQTTYQSDYVVHRDIQYPTPPYSPRESPASTPGHSLSRRTSLSRPSPMDTVDELQESSVQTIDGLPRMLRTNMISDSESSLTHRRSSSLHPDSDSLRVQSPTESDQLSPYPYDNSAEFVLGSSTGRSVNTDPGTYSPSRTLSSRPTSPTVVRNGSNSTLNNEDSHARGRNSKRFNLANVSTAFLDAVKDRVRSVSHNESDLATPTTVRNRHDREVTPVRDMTPVREVTPIRDPTPSRTQTRDQSRGRRMSPDRRRTSEVVPNGSAKEPDHHRSAFGIVGEVLGLDAEDKKQYGDGWKEYKSGVYTYPISFAIPVTSSPSISCEYGSVVWHLKAVVHRPGTFKSKLSATQEVTVVACPGEDDTEDTESVIVERQWDDQMQYLISISGRSFYIGGTIPVSLTFAPWTKMKVYKLSVVIEERVEYLTHFKRVARTDCINRISLLNLAPAHKEIPLLPLPFDDLDSFRNSPLHELVGPDDDPSEVASHFLGPGPWQLQTEVALPKSCTQLHFTNKNKRSNILISHLLKVIFRVQRGDERDVDPTSGRRKMFDIVVQTPIHILSCLCSPAYTSLPPYSGNLASASDAHYLCDRSNRLHTSIGCTSPSLPILPNGHSSTASLTSGALLHPHPSLTSTHSTQTTHPHRWQLGRHASVQSASSYSSDHPSGHTSPVPFSPAYNQFERLMTGQETELGESPPAYEDVVPP